MRGPPGRQGATDTHVAAVTLRIALGAALTARVQHTPDHFVPRGEASTSGPHPTRIFGGIPGEPAEVRITHRGAHVDHAEWVSGASPDRVEPSCAHYRSCGGCPWMHLTPEAARRWRRQRVVDAFSAVGLTPDVEAVVPCPDGDRGYRHLVKLVPSPVRGGVRLGAYGRHSHDVVRVDGCGVAAAALRRWTGLVLPVPPDLLRHVVVRRSHANGDVLATLVAWRDDPILGTLDLPAAGVALHINDRPGDAIFGPGPTRRLRGAPYIEERVGGVRLRIGPTDFFQTNPSTAARIWADLPRPERLVDLYCGIGAVSLLVGGDTFGVEVSPAAVARARENATLNRSAAEFVAGPVATTEVPERFVGATVVVNPPRAGLGAAVERVRALRPERLVYISCDPESLARDLLALNMPIERVTPYDMFPQTPHVETVVIARW
jgi:23S rRNA (uracil1939-C5)-methyltransferase